MAMDAKDLRIESALGAHSEDGNTKYAQSGTAFQHNGNKPYHDIGSSSLAKVDVPASRPCAIIGPDRVVPPQTTNDAYIKKVPVEPWPCSDTVYQHPPEYPHKPTEYQLSRNISPRQTFQENMQRIMVPPTYASVKSSEDLCLKNPKLTPLESKFCDVPYTISPLNNEPKVVKSSEGLVLNNSNQPVLPHGWTSSGVNVRPLRPYGAPDLYQYSEYPNCPGPRPVSMIRPHRNVHEDMPQVYQDRFHEANVRFKPYPTTKERPLQNQHSRYDYIPNYPNVFQPHVPYSSHKYDLQKSIPPHPYSVYPPVPLKYLERRMPIPAMEKYPRSPGQPINFNQPFCNQNIPSTYGTLPGNNLQNRAYPYAPDPSTKNMLHNRLYFDNNNSRKYYTNPENMYVNDINRPPTIKNDIMYPSYPPLNIHSLPPHHMYRKESSMKAYEHPIHYRNIEYAANMNPLSRIPLQFSPQTMSMSPSDSITSNDTTQMLGSAQDDCGYASQSSTASIRSIESGVHRISNDIYRRHDTTLPHMNKFGQKLDTTTSSKDKKGLNVRQFLQMWNEGDDEGNDSNKDTTKQRDSSNSLGCYEPANNQEQLYVLGLVNVPKEELAKYEHIQKISKLPENIKGYNSIELLNQYEKLVESPGLNQFSPTPSQSKQKDLHVPIRNSFPRHGMDVSSASTRPLSPLDVEAKISQSVIHKEVGCNFEIRPCSPQMMNVEIATPVHNVLGERLIEKVVNPVTTKSPLCQRIEETNSISSRNSPKVTSCKMINSRYPSPHLNDSLKTNYCLQDLESNSGVCLASLPRLDNDIELNFPEINQQFINDNKILPIRDLPILDTENDSNAHNSRNKIYNQPFITEQLNSGSDSDKDVSKLSKYRKQKRNLISNDNDDNLNISQHRTDSVIIENPENTRSQEEHINNVPLNNNNNSDIENVVNPLNTLVEIDKATNYSDKNIPVILEEKNTNCQPIDSDTAIDFSLNKCDSILNSSINSLSNLSDALKNNHEMYNENIHKGIDKPCSPKLPVLLEETDATDDFSILQPKSPSVASVTCSKILDNDIMLLSVAEDNKDRNTCETVITHSKSNDMVTDMSIANISSTTVEIDSHNVLSTIDHDIGNISTSRTVSNNDISENVSALNGDIENQALNYCLAENPDALVTYRACEQKYNLTEENRKEQDFVKDLDVEEDNLCSEKEEKVSPVCEHKYNLTEEIRKQDIVKDLDVEKGNLCSEKEEIVSPVCEQKYNLTEENRKQQDIVKDLDVEKDNLCLEKEEKGSPVCEQKYNLTEVDRKEQDIVKDLDLEEDNLCSEKEEKAPLTQESLANNDSQILLDSDMKNNSTEDLTIQKQGQNIQTVPIEAVCDEDSSNMLEGMNEISIPKKLNDQDINDIDLKSYDCVDFINNASIKTDSEKRITDDSDSINIDPSKSPDGSHNDLIETSMKDFYSSNIPCTEVEMLENNDSISETKANKNMLGDIKDESDILNKHLITELLKDDAESFQVKFKLSLNKELFSSRFQNLIIFKEGTCSYGNEKKVSSDFNTNINSLQPLDNMKKSIEALFDNNDVDPEDQNITNSNLISTNNNVTTNNVTSDNPTLSKVHDVIAIKSKHEDSSDVTIDMHNMLQENVMLNDFENKILAESTESSLMKNNDAESLLDVAEDESLNKILHKNIINNDKLNNNVEEKSPLHLTLNQSSNKRNRTLKRSLSESAIAEYTTAAIDIKGNYDSHFKNGKRAKFADSEILVESQVLPENFTSFIQNNRRNSVSTIYNDENVSFCIFIDNDCVLAEENEDCQKICYTEIPNDCLTTICTEGDVLNSELSDISYEGTAEICGEEPVDSELTADIYFEDNVFICGKEDNIHSELDSENISYEEECPRENYLISQNMEESAIDETWVEDVACMETVFSEDIAEDVVISAPSSPKDSESSDEESNNTNFVYNINENEHTNKVKNIYGKKMCDNDAELVEKLFRTPQMNVNKTLINRESQLSVENNRYYDNESLEKVLSESNTLDTQSLTSNDLILEKPLVLPSNVTSDVHRNKENLQDLLQENKHEIYSTVELPNIVETKLSQEKEMKELSDCLIHSCESSCDNITSNKKDEKLQYTISSSPEVSSTTSEEKGPAILLKIRSYKGSKISEVNEMNASFNHSHSHRPLITKAAQKYIPPLKETIHDLKVKIRLPKHSLYKLQQLKKSKEEPKIDTNCSKLYIKNIPHENLKKAKPKPKFEDVLKSIDEIQYKKHKTKIKKNKPSVPKVIIKKNENGAHYASTKSNETFNPDLTGRKWQPWVFLEKSNFVDKMALKQKFKAIYNHRKKTFVLAENFRKYKSISNAKFVISHPKPNDNFSTGNLKYTFRLKHS